MQNAGSNYNDADTGKTGYSGVAADGQKAYKNYKVVASLLTAAHTRKGCTRKGCTRNNLGITEMPWHCRLMQQMAM